MNAAEPSSQALLTTTPPALKEAGVTFRLLTAPDETGRRMAEGGLRTQGRFKQTHPELPLVTVITVCFKAAATLEQCMRSVFEQTYRNIEYIVIDGGSPDNTTELLERHAADIDYYVSEPDGGLYQAMNKGLALASGDYILMLNADDWYAETAVEELLAAKRYAGTDFVSALAQAVDQNEKHVAVMRSMNFDDNVRLRMPLRHETMLVPAAVYDKVGNYDESFRIIADYALTIRVFEAAYTHYEVPRPLLFFRNTGVSNTNSAGLLAERIRVLASQFPFLAPEEIELLADRDRHTGRQLLDLAGKHAAQLPLVRALHTYIEDNARAGLQGRGRKQWRGAEKSHLQELLLIIRSHRTSLSPQISIILPVFKGEATLPACIESVLAQTFTDFELICINDQSPDDAQTIIDRYCERDQRVRAVVNPVNVGLGSSRNRGVQMARGIYVFHIDPDDTIPPHALEVLHACAVENDSELVRGAYMREQFHHGSSNYTPDIKYPLKKQRRVINAQAADVDDLIKMPEGHWAFLYRTDLARRIPYPQDLKMGQDAIFLCCVLPAARSISVIPDVVYNYLVNAESAMNVFNFRKYMDVLEWRRRALHVLADHGLRELGVRLVRAYAHLPWHDQFARHYAAAPNPAELNALGKALRAAHAEAGLAQIDPKAPPQRRDFLQHLLDGREADAALLLQAKPQVVAEASPLRPKVSIILPFFKAELTLRESLDSVLAQTLEDFEVVCVNDQSPDGSQAIVDEYHARDPRIVPVLNEANIGHGASRNHGVAVARGEYVFHLDPDDTLPPDALHSLYALAVRYGSDMTRGAYMHEQSLFGQSAKKTARRGLKAGSQHIVNTSLKAMPDLLRSTEGHWSYMYRSEFAKRVFYPTDLKMGQDSIFIVGALVAAKSISLTDAVVYQYRANPDSAMNTFTFRKFMDALEWRRRAWHVLNEAGLRESGDRLLQVYWSDQFFRSLATTVTREQVTEFFAKFRQAFAEAAIDTLRMPASDFVSRLFPLILAGRDSAALTLMHDGKPPAQIKKKPQTQTKATTLPQISGLRIATFSSRDHGGAGTGTQRRVAALRQHGVDATIHSLLVSTTLPYVKKVQPHLDDGTVMEAGGVWQEVRKRAILPATNLPGFRASELFSLHQSVVDFRQMREVFDQADIVHMHWVVGMFDYEHAAETLADKPMTWTLADMNAFTGGCHYSEGCEEFKRECRNCTLLGGESDLAHETWKVKKTAYAKLKNLHIICPSQWMADQARASSLFGDKPIHCIPNAFPVDKYIPTNKTVARVRLGLPTNKKLLLFGADNLSSRRKGGDKLIGAIRLLKNEQQLKDVEVVVFGKSTLNLPVRVHSLGHINDDKHLALAYAAADAFLFPSLEDNAPLTVGESLLCGTPVVAFPVGNVPDLIEHQITGYLAPHLDIADFAKGIEWALSASRAEAVRRSIACRLRAIDFHDPGTAARRHLAVYKQAMEATLRHPESTSVPALQQ